MSDVKFSKPVQDQIDQRNREEQRAALRRTALRDVARTLYDAPAGFEASDQDAQEVQDVLNRAYARHRQREASRAASASASRGTSVAASSL